MAKHKAKKIAKKSKAKASKIKKSTAKAAKKSAKPMKKAVKKSAAKKMSSAGSKPVAKIYKPAVTVGKELPDLTLPATGGTEISLTELRGKRVVLFFYPKDSTPGCTIEGRDFTRLHEEFKATNTEVFGVSRDSLKSHDKFKECEGYSVELLSDEKEEACKLFGVIKMKNMYGKQVRGIERSTFVIDQDGRLVKEWRGVSVPGHADEVLSYVKTL